MLPLPVAEEGSPNRLRRESSEAIRGGKTTSSGVSELSRRSPAQARKRDDTELARRIRSRAVGGPSERRPGNGKCGKAEAAPTEREEDAPCL